ncbi:MAG: lasso peptide biosynthesis B2 protein [Brevundimonas sp.]|jgi:hypothetical protein|uniref:lasso peptide biosynthesis B2 protein n=1 Tax=Brevundimonas sp. TaxID=1871086 RepID=UPI0025BB7E76|nr:lasso peptide biosynthesis B2 protein [Brevundimonas sp.]MCH4269656.1 lasso peptide biosynthesis B2 protein [Brevundimonas sp.]
MSKNLWCAPDVYLARIDDDVMMLDLLADQYRCLLGAGDAFQIQANGQIIAADNDVADELKAVGIAVDRPLTTPRPILIPADRELPLSQSPSLDKELRCILALGFGALAFRGKSLEELIKTEPVVPKRVRPFRDEELTALVGTARRARPWVPFEGECLQRSFQLRRFLGSRGAAVDWVFGVRTWPFAAHCWLQTGDLVVGDRLDRVGRFTPIMRV